MWVSAQKLRNTPQVRSCIRICTFWAADSEVSLRWSPGVASPISFMRCRTLEAGFGDVSEENSCRGCFCDSFLGRLYRGWPHRLWLCHLRLSGKLRSPPTWWAGHLSRICAQLNTPRELVSKLPLWWILCTGVFCSICMRCFHRDNDTAVRTILHTSCFY